MTSSEALSWTALEKVHDRFAAIAFEVCNAQKSVAPQLLILDVDSTGEVSGFSALPIELLVKFYESDENKERLGAFIKSMLTRGSKQSTHFHEQAGFYPNLLVQINEAEVLDSSAAAEDWDAVVSGKVRVSSSKHKKDCLAITLHTPERSIPMVHFIESAPTRHCVPSKFPQENNAMHSGGRFSMNERLAKERGPLH